MTDRTVKHWAIRNGRTGAYYGTYDAGDPATALDVRARMAGYDDHADCVAKAGGRDDLEAIEVEDEE